MEQGFNRFGGFLNPFFCWVQLFPGAVSLLKEVDVRCRTQLDSAADAVGHGQVGGNFSESNHMGRGLEVFPGSDILTPTSYVDPLVVPLTFACRPRLTTPWHRSW